MRRKVTIVLEGNDRKIENVIHSLMKTQQEINAEPELSATLHTDTVDKTEYNGFSNKHD